MKVHTEKAGTLIGFLSCAGLAFGLAFGVIKSAHLGIVPAILSFLAVIAFQWFIFRSGKSAAYASAQSWAQANVDIALEVSNIARAQAESLSNAYSTAISQANATAQNITYVQLSDGSVLPLKNQENFENTKEIAQEVFLGQMTDYSEILKQVQLQREVSNEARDEDGSTVAVGELDQEEPSLMRPSSDS